MRSLFLGLGSLVLAATAGCAVMTEGRSSSGSASGSAPTYASTTADVATANLFPSMSATADETGVTVYVAFVYQGTFLSLGEGDSLVATVGGTSQTLAREASDDPNEVHYTTRIAAPGATSATIAFLRGGDRVSAPYSTIRFPEPFTVTGPASFTRADGGIALVVKPLVPVLVEADGDCVASQAAPFGLWVDANGNGFFGDTPGTSIFDWNRTNCPVTVHVQTHSIGTYDGAFQDQKDIDESFDVARMRSFVTVMNPGR